MNETEATTTIRTHWRQQEQQNWIKRQKNMAKILSKSWQQRKEKVSKYSIILLSNILIFRKDKKENITEKCLNLNNS